MVYFTDLFWTRSINFMSILGWLVVAMFAFASLWHIIMYMRDRMYHNYILTPKHRKGIN